VDRPALPSGVVTRRADPADAPVLAALRFEWRTVEGGEEGLAAEDYVARFAGWMADRGASHLAFVAERDTVAVAMAWLAIVERVPGPGRWLRRAGLVQSAYVVAAERNQRIGGALMACVIESARELGLDYVAVHPSERSFPFYRRLGFTVTGCELELDLRIPAGS
jgi:GNAT superfamily N-acetyltransferase